MLARCSGCWHRPPLQLDQSPLSKAELAALEGLGLRLLCVCSGEEEEDDDDAALISVGNPKDKAPPPPKALQDASP